MNVRDLTTPIRVDEHDAVRVGDTNVQFYLVVRSYKQGHTPEEIIRQFETLTLAEAYGAITYFLQNRDQVEAYLEAVDREAEQVQQKLKEAGMYADANDLSQEPKPS